MPRGSLRHISLEVGNIARSRWFYDRFFRRLDFRRIASEADYLGYSDGTMTIWLLRGHPPRIRRHPPSGDEEVIPEHIAFHLPSAGLVRSIEAELSELEIYPFFRGEEHPEFRRGYFSATWVDPDGIAVELYAIEGAQGAQRRRRTSGRKTPRRPPSRRRAGRRRRE